MLCLHIDKKCNHQKLISEVMNSFNKSFNLLLLENFDNDCAQMIHHQDANDEKAAEGIISLH